MVDEIRLIKYEMEDEIRLIKYEMVDEKRYNKNINHLMSFYHLPCHISCHIIIYHVIYHVISSSTMSYIISSHHLPSHLIIYHVISSSIMSSHLIFTYLISSYHQFLTFLAISGLAPCSIKIRDISGRSLEAA